jgi:hypothetical protein
MPPQEDLPIRDTASEDHRKFLATCGKFAIMTPPALTAAAVHVAEFRSHCIVFWK